MRKQTASFNTLQWPKHWCHQVLLCVLLIAFSTTTYAAPGDNSDKRLSAQQKSDSVFILSLSSSVSEVQADEPEYDKAVDISSYALQNLPAGSLHVLIKTVSFAPKWNWHLVRGPPTHL